MKLRSTSPSYGPPVSACLGKQQYESFNAAARVVKRQRGNIMVKDGTLQIYKCRYCHHWHMGGGSGGRK